MMASNPILDQIRAQPKSSINNPTLPADVYGKIYVQPSQPKTVNLGDINTVQRPSGGGGGGGGGSSYSGGVVQTPTGGVSTATPEKYNQNRPESNLKEQIIPKSNTIQNQLRNQIINSPPKPSESPGVRTFPAQRLPGVRSIDYVQETPYTEVTQSTLYEDGFGWHTETPVTITTTGTKVNAWTETRTGFDVWGDTGNTYTNFVNPIGGISTYVTKPGDKFAVGAGGEIKTFSSNETITKGYSQFDPMTGERLYSGQTAEQIYKNTKDKYGKHSDTLLTLYAGTTSADPLFLKSIYVTGKDILGFAGNKLFGTEYNPNEYTTKMESIRKESVTSARFSDTGEQIIMPLKNPVETLKRSPTAQSALIVGGSNLVIGRIAGELSLKIGTSKIGTSILSKAIPVTTKALTYAPAITSLAYQPTLLAAQSNYVKTKSDIISRGGSSEDVFTHYGQLGINFAVGTKTFTTGFGSAYSFVNTQLDKLKKEQFIQSGTEVFKDETGAFYNIRLARSTGRAKQELEFRMPAFKNVKPEVYGLSESGERTLLEKGTIDYSAHITRATSTTKVSSPILGTIYKTEQGFSGTVNIPGSNIINGIKIINKDEGITTAYNYPNVQYSSGKANIKIKGKSGYKEFEVSGLMAESDKYYNVVGLRPTTKMTYPEMTEIKKVLLGRKDIFIENQPALSYKKLRETRLGEYDPVKNKININIRFLKGEHYLYSESDVIRHETAHAIYRERFSPYNNELLRKELKYNEMIAQTTIGKKLLKGGYPKSQLATETFARVLQYPKGSEYSKIAISKVKEQIPVFYNEIIKPGMNPLYSISKYKTVTKTTPERNFLRIDLRKDIISVGQIKRYIPPKGSDVTRIISTGTKTRPSLNNGGSLLTEQVTKQVTMRNPIPSIIPSYSKSAGSVLLNEAKVSRSAWYGTGKYELTSGSVSSLSMTKPSSVIISQEQSINNWQPPVKSSLTTVQVDKGRSSFIVNNFVQPQPSKDLNKIKNTQRGGYSFTFSSNQGSSIINKQSDINAQRQNYRQRQDQRQTQKQTQRTFNPLTPFATTTFGYPPFIPPIVPRLPKIGESYNRYSRKRRQQTSYTPSLAASVFGIYGKPNKIGKDVYGGIYGGGIRPIPLLGKLKKSRRKKK